MQEEITQAIQTYLNEETKDIFRTEVEELIKNNNTDELYDRFYRNLEFGTAGLRGIIGGGTNRMNNYVVKRATQGMANYVIKAFPEQAKKGELRVAIAYDCRNFSKEFALAAALIFVANGFTCYLFSDLRPTPELSYAIRTLSCHTGVVVTASHNPKQYNGYKAYWADGAQITPPHDEGIIKEVLAVQKIHEISEKEAKDSGKLQIIDDRIDIPFWELVKSKITRKDLILKKAREIKIVYTPLHGTGALHVEKVLADFGFSVITVPEQREPDGNFPTASYPNPEEKAALTMAIELAEKEGADIVMATDPDSDRFAAAVRNKQGLMQIITGNQIGALYADYLCLTAQEQKRLPKDGLIVRSIVTSNLVDHIAESYGIKAVECLTGFKWICGVAETCEKTGLGTYMYGFEESYGYNFGPELRDKDGITAAALCAEMAIYWNDKGISLLDRLDELFITHGVFTEKTISKVFEGASGVKTMQSMMQKLRTQSITEIAGFRVKKIRDIQTSVEYSPEHKEKTTKIDLPKSNVLQYFLEGGSILCVRPSGTEPKIKIYILHQKPCVDAGKLEHIKKQAHDEIDRFEKAINDILKV